MGLWDQCVGLWDLCVDFWDLCGGLWDQCVGLWDRCAGLWDQYAGLWDKRVGLWDQYVSLWDPSVSLVHGRGSCTDLWDSPLVLLNAYVYFFVLSISWKRIPFYLSKILPRADSSSMVPPDMRPTIRKIQMPPTTIVPSCESRYDRAEKSKWSRRTIYLSSDLLPRGEATGFGH